MAEPEYPVLQELETKLKLLWVDTDDVMATQRAIIQVEPELAYLELPRGRKGDKGDPGPAISIQGIVAADSQLPANAEIGHAYVNTTTKGLAVWNGSQWFKVNDFAGVDADVQQFSRWFAQIESDTRRAVDAAKRAEFAAEETIQQVEGDFATRNYVDAIKPDVDRGNAEKWLNDAEIPNYSTIPSGSYRATAGFLRGVGIDDPNAGRFTRTYVTGSGAFTDRVEYVRANVPYVWFRTVTPTVTGDWLPGDLGVSNAVGNLQDELGQQTTKIERGTGEAWLRAEDVDRYRDIEPGSYRALTSFLQGIGVDVTNYGRFERTWLSNDGSNFIDHVTWIETGSVVHHRYRSAWSTGMSDWINPDDRVSTSGTISISRAEAVRERLFQSRGGRVGTGGKGVVALRFDHGVPAFTEHILPMLQARGLPASQCHFIDDPEADWEQANVNFGSGIEVHSHSWTHNDASTSSGIHKEIVESRDELEQLIPQASVAGWMAPGIGSPGYGGWWDAGGMEERAGFLAQQYIDSTYGASDMGGSVWNVLGTRHWGHRSIDRDSSFGQWQSLIDQAADTKTGVVLMIHPSFVRDSSSYIDFSEYEQVLDYIVQMRDSGRIEVLTVAGMTLADPTIGYRDNMLHGDLTIWDGWGSGDSRTGNSNSGALTHSVSLANIRHVKGHVREFTIDASGAGTLQIRIYDSDTTLLDTTRTVQVTDAQKIRIPVGIPLEGSRIRFTITCSSGSVAVTNPKLQAV